MKTFNTTKLYRMSWLVIASLLIWTGLAEAAEKQSKSAPDRTLSPYFFIASDDPTTDRLPLKSTRAEVRIAGVIAEVVVTQVYKNEGKKALEAIYVFPASTRAAVHAMRMTVGERTIEAQIMERKEARATYEQAKQQGQTTSLLEQQRPNVFTMNVANILPGDEIKVELKYTELLVPEERVYEFVYPAVVGPRYSNTPAAAAADSEKWVENPYLREGSSTPYAFGLKVHVNAGLPLAQLASPSHEVAIDYKDQTQAQVTVKDDPKAGTKDFVLRYQLAGGAIKSGLLLFPGQEENHFLMMMQPPARVEAAAVVPREYIFIVDVSGSMNGFPLEQVGKPLVKEIIKGLRTNDFMNVMLFSGGSAVLSAKGSWPATVENKGKAISFIDSRQGSGGTEILPALQQALALPRTEGVSRIIVVVTDGYVTVEPEVFELIKKNLGQANLFAFGVGTAVNRHIMEGMARAGEGESFIILNPIDGQKQAARFRQYVDRPVLTGVSVKFEGFSAYDVEPAAVPDLFAERPIVVMGKYRGQPAGNILVTGRTAAGEFRQVINVDSGLASPDNAALRLLWARQRITQMADLNQLGPSDDRIKAVTALGLKYSLMTQFTSFVAVDQVKRASGEVVTVKQPLPMPEGVSDLAVGEPRGGMIGGLMKQKASKPALPYRYNQSAAPEPTRDGSLPAVTSSGRTEVKVADKKETEKDDTSGPVVIVVEDIRGGLGRVDVRKVLREKQAQFEACLAKKANQDQIKGEVSFRLEIGPDGRVKEVKIVSASFMDQTLKECFQAVLTGLLFPPPQDGQAQILIRLKSNSRN